MDELDMRLVQVVERMEDDAFRNLVQKLVSSLGLEVRSSEFRQERGDIVADVGAQIEDAYYPAYYVRVGRGRDIVPPEDLQDFVAVKEDRENGMIFITTSEVTDDAMVYAEEFDVEVVNGESLAAMLKKFQLLPDVMMYRDQKILSREVGRYLPSVDELENTMDSGTRAYSRGDLVEALRYFTRVTQKKPTYDMAWYMKGVILNDLARYEEALGAFTRALECNVDNEKAWYSMAIALYNLGRYKEELECYDRAIELSRGFLEAWNNKGATLLQMERYDEAIQCYDEILRLDPNFKMAWNNRGIALKKLKKRAEALECFTNALKIDSRYADAWLNKGLISLDLKRNKDAYLSFQALLFLDPDNIQGLYNMGKTLEKVGQYTKAIACYDRIITLDGSFKAAKRRHKKASKALEEEGDSDLDEDFFRVSPNRADEFRVAPGPPVSQHILVSKKQYGTVGTVAVPAPVSIPAETVVEESHTAPPSPPPFEESTVIHEKTQIQDIEGERKQLEKMAGELEKKGRALAGAEKSMKKEMAKIVKEKQYLTARAKFIAEKGQQYDGEKEALEKKMGELESKEEEIRKAGELVDREKGLLESEREALERERTQMEDTMKELTSKESALAQKERELKAKLEEKKQQLQTIETNLKSEQEGVDRERKFLEDEKASIEKERESLERTMQKLILKEQDIKAKAEAISQEKEDTLREERDKAIEELAERESTVHTREEELKRRHDELEKKMEDIEQREREMGRISDDLRKKQENIEDQARMLQEKENDLMAKSQMLAHQDTQEAEAVAGDQGHMSTDADDGVDFEEEVARRAEETSAAEPEVPMDRGTVSGYTGEEIEVVRRAHAAYSLRKFDEALAFIETALQEGVDSKYLLNMKGNILRDGRQLEDAVTCYKNALELDQKYVVTLANLLSLSRELSNYDEAAKWCDKILSLRPRDVKFLVEKALLEARTGDLDSAVAALDTALEGNSEQDVVWNLKGVLLQGLDRDDDALECFDAALSVNSENGVALNNKGYVLHKKGRYQEGLECFNSALAISGSDGISQNIALTNKALLSSQGEPEPAEGLFEGVARVETEIQEAEEEGEEEDEEETEAEEEEEEGSETGDAGDDSDESGASLHMCPFCGAFVSAAATKCDQCGNSFDSEDEYEESGEGVEGEDDSVVDEDEEEGGSDESSGEDDEESIRDIFMQLAGIGSSKADALFEAGYGDLESLRNASASELSQVNGISENLAKSIKKQLKDIESKDG